MGQQAGSAAEWCCRHSTGCVCGGAAVDLLHEDAMSQMGGDANNVSEGVAGVDGGAEEYSGSDGEACMEDNGTVVGSDEGDHWSQAMFYAIA